MNFSKILLDFTLQSVIEFSKAEFDKNRSNITTTNLSVVCKNILGGEGKNSYDIPIHA